MTEPTNTSGGGEAPLPDDTAAQHASAPETAPRGTHVMAVVRWMILIAMTAVAGWSVWTLWGPVAAPPDHRDDAYYCPMHPQIRSSQPGECPICHMDLEPIPRDRMAREPAAAAMQSMPADASATSDAGRNDDASMAGIVPVTVSLERQQLVGVATAPVTTRTLRQSLRVPAVVEAPENAIAQVHVRAAGFLERVAVRQTGVRVTRGQTLAWFYSPTIYQAQQELLTAHRWAVATPGHVPMGPGTASAEAHVPAQGTGQGSDIEMAARRNLELLGLTSADLDGILQRGTAMRAVPIRAPASGYITRFTAELGSYATPETTLYEIADLSRVWVIASAYEADLARIRRGMRAEFVSPDAPDRPLVATVDLVEPEIAVTTRTARVRLVVVNPAMRLRPGQFGEVHFDLPSSSALVIARDAVIDTGRSKYVFVDSGNGRFEPRAVRTGAMVDDMLQVLDGLREGERVVTRGSFMIDSESRLAASLAETPAQADGGRVSP